MHFPKPSARAGRDTRSSFIRIFFGHVRVCVYSISYSVGWGCRIHRLHLCREVSSINECLGYDTKSDGEAPVILELWGMLNTPSLLSLSGPLWPEC